MANQAQNRSRNTRTSADSRFPARNWATVESDPFFLPPDHNVRVADEAPLPFPSAEGQVPPTFSVGDIVAVKASPSSHGVIRRVIDTEPPGTYEVFVDGRDRPFYGLQLALKVDSHPKVIAGSTEEFHARLTAELVSGTTDRSKLSLADAGLDFVPEQINALSTYLRTPDHRFLLSLPTGEGKTVVAGMIIRELMGRSQLPRVLIVCPKPLIAEGKIQNEMGRLGLEFTRPARREFLRCVQEMHAGAEWDPSLARIVVPYSYLDDELLHGAKDGNAGGGLLDLDPAPLFDLVIVDEAHHIRNPHTRQHQAVGFFCRDALAVLYLSASPIQLGDRDLYNILTTLGADPGMDRQGFAGMMEAVPYLSRARREAAAADAGWEPRALKHLEEAEQTAWGQTALVMDPVFSRTKLSLASGVLNDRERLALATDIGTLSPLSGLMCSGSADQRNGLTIRKAATISIEPTPPQRELHDGLVQLYRSLMAKLYGDHHALFHSTTFMQQAASSINAIAPHIGDILGRSLAKLEQQIGTNGVDDGGDLATFETHIRRLVREAEVLGDDDPKLAALLDIVEQKRCANNPKVMIFAHFRHTLAYLFDGLTERGFKVAMVHGVVSDHERVKIKRRFRSQPDDPASVQVLLASDVCSEGLDYEFCDTVVDYDLPWNPMIVEQRIGRIDRRGQRSKTVLVYHLVTPGTIDDEIHGRCVQRISRFEDTVRKGKPVLGTVRSKTGDLAVDAALSDADAQKLNQARRDAHVASVLTTESLRNENFLGIGLPGHEIDAQGSAAGSPWLSPGALENLLRVYLNGQGWAREYDLHGLGVARTIRMSRSLRKRILDELTVPGLPETESLRRWHYWLSGHQDNLRVTFMRSGLVPQGVGILGPEHPLVMQAALWTTRDARTVSIKVRAFHEEIPPGDYPFSVYRWIYRGVGEHVAIVPVCDSDLIQPLLSELLLSGTVESPDVQVNRLPATSGGCEAAHRKLWAEAVQRFKCDSSSMANRLVGTLEASHAARTRILRQRCSQEDITIAARQSYASKIQTLDDDFAQRKEDIDRKGQCADIHFERLVAGTLKITDSLDTGASVSEVGRPMQAIGQSVDVQLRVVA
jgi:ATP-dependent helicase HepA